LVDLIRDGLAGQPALRATVQADEAGRGIVRAGLTFDGPDAGARARALADFLASGDPPIYIRGHLLAEGTVTIDPRPIDEHEARIIVERVRTFLATH
jgi:hypothetical protein